MKNWFKPSQKVKKLKKQFKVAQFQNSAGFENTYKFDYCPQVNQELNCINKSLKDFKKEYEDLKVFWDFKKKYFKSKFLSFKNNFRRN